MGGLAAVSGRNGQRERLAFAEAMVQARRRVAPAEPGDYFRPSVNQ
jgi:hypothetical protein